MAERRSNLPKLKAFGAYLAHLRADAKLSTAGVEQRLWERKSVKFGRSTLTQYEQGAVWAPDPVVLGGLAEIYGTDVRCFISVLKVNRADPSLDDRGVEQVLRDVAHQRDEEAGASTRLAEIRAALGVIGAELVKLAERSTSLAGGQTAGVGASPSVIGKAGRSDRRSAAAGARGK